MSKIVVVAVRDQKADAFGHPWYAQTLPMAIRHFSDAVNTSDETNLWRKHPEDFALFKLGTFDTHTGLFETENPSQLCLASEILPK